MAARRLCLTERSALRVCSSVLYRCDADQLSLREGQTQEKDHGSSENAKKFAEKMIREKEKKGYERSSEGSAEKGKKRQAKRGKGSDDDGDGSESSDAEEDGDDGDEEPKPKVRRR